jgi:hypothetical protein
VRQPETSKSRYKARNGGRRVFTNYVSIRQILFVFGALEVALVVLRPAFARALH